MLLFVLPLHLHILYENSILTYTYYTQNSILTLINNRFYRCHPACCFYASKWSVVFFGPPADFPYAGFMVKKLDCG